MKIQLRAFGSYDGDAASLEAGLSFEGQRSLAKQEFLEDSDINVIVRRFGLSGQVPGDFEMPQSGDFTVIGDFSEAMQQVRAAEEAFMRLPAELRTRFANDPAVLIAFLGDERNREEAIRLGLVQKPVEKTRDVVQAVDELAAKMSQKA